MNKPDLVGGDDRDVVDRQDKVEHVEGVGPHDDPHAAVVDDFSIVQFDEGIGVPNTYKICLI